jgi:hypothetical protein
MMRSALLLLVLALFACSPKGPNETKVAVNSGKGDSSACAEICDASAACGDAPQTCVSRCNEWLIRRSRPGIAKTAAACAVPRIDNACEKDTSRAAAKALVACVDDAGRDALRKDKTSLLTAARAICERGARCGGGSTKEAGKCVERITSQNPPPRGLGIFGAVKPELVEEFASCMQSSECGPGGAVCFGEMLGETGGDDVEEAPKSSPVTPTVPVEGGSKI